MTTVSNTTKQIITLKTDISDYYLYTRWRIDAISPRAVIELALWLRYCKRLQPIQMKKIGVVKKGAHKTPSFELTLQLAKIVLSAYRMIYHCVVCNHS